MASVAAPPAAPVTAPLAAAAPPVAAPVPAPKAAEVPGARRCDATGVGDGDVRVRSGETTVTRGVLYTCVT